MHSWHLLLFLPLIQCQQQFGLNFQQQPYFPVLQGVPQMPQLSVQPFPGLTSLQQPQPAQVFPQPSLPVQGFGAFSQPQVPQGQFNPLFPFALPGFHTFAPFPGVVTVSPIYSTNQAQLQGQVPQQPQVQGAQSQGQPQATQNQLSAAQTPSPVVSKPQVEHSVQVEPPTSTVPSTIVPTTVKPVEGTTLPVVDSRSDPKPPKKSTTVAPVEEIEEDEEEEDTPPEVPKELTNIRETLEDDEEEKVEETATVKPQTKNQRKDLTKGSSAPKVLDFRSINQAKIAAAVKAKAVNDQKEVDEILNKVLDAVQPLHQIPTATGESEFRS